MYANCPDPHGQSNELERLDYQLVSVIVSRAVSMLSETAEENLKILDLGCGLGYFTTEVKNRFPKAEVSGADISRNAIDRARMQSPACHFFVFDIRDDFLPGTSFDLVLTLNILCYLTDDEIHGALRNLNTLLRPGGFVMVGHHLPEKMRFGRFIQSLEDAAKLFANHGLKMVYGIDIRNSIDLIYSGDVAGRHIYFLCRKECREK